MIEESYDECPTAHTFVNITAKLMVLDSPAARVEECKKLVSDLETHFDKLVLG